MQINRNNQSGYPMSFATRAALASSIALGALAQALPAQAEAAIERDYLPVDIVVTAVRDSYAEDDGSTGTKTDTPLIDVPQADDATVLAAMAADPALIERPLVETPRGVRLCRPSERLDEII